MKIGLALAGGGLKGVAYIGVFKALEELGVRPDYISGTSSGSMAAVFYAVGYNCDEIKDIVCKSYKKLTKIQRAPLLSSISTYLTKRKINIEGLIPGERLENLVQDVVSKKNYRNITDIDIPIAIATVDTISAKECIFISKKEINLESDKIEYIHDIPIGKAVRASMSFPGIFPPSKYKSYNFIDGGARDNLPEKVLKDMGADVTIALSFKIDDYDIENQNVLSTLLRTIDIFSMDNLLAAQDNADLSIEINAKGSGLLEIDSIDKCIDIGYKAIMDNKERILNLIK